ncbi:MAG: Rieske 2Fe-2S domain-containing protein [Actinomycetota bacterium]|nr:Rieske 2Fe-2S domain-containing protein [Actinomycetota bacterium]
MADELERPGDDVEHHDESPHLPSPSIWPFGFALGVALVLVGLIITSWLIVAIGAAIAVVLAFLWIRDATREIRAVPPPAPPAHALPEEEEEEEEVHRYPRSVFLEGATLGIGAAIGGIVTLPALGFMVLPSFVGQEYESVDLGPLENFPEGQWIVAKFTSVAPQDEDDTGAVFRRTAYIRNNGVANGKPSFTIISNRCVHLGCPVRPQGITDEKPKRVETKNGGVELFGTQPNGFGCPCHGGAYDTEGNRTAGPPVRALDRYEFSIVNGRLVLDKPYSVGKVDGSGADAKIIAYELVDPGQHVDGPEQYFYPYVP